MTDVFSKAKRSLVMAGIRSRGNASTEQAVAKLFRMKRITGWRRHAAVKGRPDFYFSRQRVAVFIDGCFWHRCPLHCQLPASRRAWWKRKLLATAIRDLQVTTGLRREGIRVVRVWEHDLGPLRIESLAARIKRALRQSAPK